MEHLLDIIASLCERDSKYYDIRYMEEAGRFVSYRNGEFQGAGESLERGIAVRVVNEGISYGFFNDENKASEVVGRTIDRSHKNGKNQISGGTPITDKWEVKASQSPGDFSLDDRIDLVKSMDSLMNDLNAGVRINVLNDREVRQLYVNSLGSRIEGKFPRIGYYYVMGFNQNGSFEQSHNQFGITGGYENFGTMKIEEEVKDDARKLSSAATAAKIEPGRYDVILGPDLSGIVAHESCGHPTEYDRIIGREGALAGESFLSGKDFPYRVGSEDVSVIDDPTMTGSYGYYKYDDEGIMARKRYLYRNGLTSEFILNRESVAILGMESNAGGRSSSWNHEPLARMSTTYIEPGEMSLDELVEGVKLGVYMGSYTEWNIDDIRFNQKYVGKDSFMIRNGKLAEQVRRPILETTTTGLYSAVDGTSKELHFSAGTCGKGEPEQGIEVWMGGPHVRLRNMYLS